MYSEGELHVFWFHSETIQVFIESFVGLLLSLRTTHFHWQRAPAKLSNSHESHRFQHQPHHLQHLQSKPAVTGTSSARGMCQRARASVFPWSATGVDPVSEDEADRPQPSPCCCCGTRSTSSKGWSLWMQRRAGCCVCSYRKHTLGTGLFFILPSQSKAGRQQKKELAVIHQEILFYCVGL